MPARLRLVWADALRELADRAMSNVLEQDAMVQVGRWHSTVVRNKQVEKPEDQDDAASKKVGEWANTWRSVQCT